VRALLESDGPQRAACECANNPKYCKRSYYFGYHCVAPVLPDTCTADSDCPSGWTCEPNTAGVDLCVPGFNDPPTGAMKCRPPLWELVGDKTVGGPMKSFPDCPDNSAAGDAGVAATGGSAAIASDASVSTTNALLSQDAGAKGGCACAVVARQRKSQAATWLILAMLFIGRRRRQLAP